MIVIWHGVFCSAAWQTQAMGGATIRRFPTATMQSFTERQDAKRWQAFGGTRSAGNGPANVALSQAPQDDWPTQGARMVAKWRRNPCPMAAKGCGQTARRGTMRDDKPPRSIPPQLGRPRGIKGIFYCRGSISAKIICTTVTFGHRAISCE